MARATSRSRGVEQSLKAEVLAGGRTMPLQLRARFGQPGAYATYFQPTKAGQYRFRIFGQIEARPSTRRSSLVRPLQRRGIAERAAISRSAGRVPDKPEARLETAEARANTAQSLGIAGLVVGLLGLGAAGIALLRRSPVGKGTS